MAPTRPIIALTLPILLAAAAARAQTPKPLGTVPIAEADVTNGSAAPVTVAAGRASLTGNSAVTALQRNASIALARGGSVLLCQTSSLHVMSGAQPPALLLALDRGALEIRTAGLPGDTIMTPDLRFTPAAAGPLQFDMRVEPNGDTCVDNRGKKAPTLSIADAYGQATYLLKPGQHVTFEHGSLRAVIDRETTPCGCPPDIKPVPLADALLSGKPGTVTPAQTAAAYPFPAAQSAGLAPTPPREPETPGETHVQAASTLSFDPAAAKSPRTADPDDAAATVASSGATPAASAPAQPSRGVFGSIGHFFKRIFVR